MKTRNIITIISIIFALVSCSADNDILNDIPVQNTEVSEVTISCIIDNIQTKSSEVAEDQKINNVVLFLLDKEGNVLGYRKQKESTFQTKKQDNLSVLAVVNAVTDVTSLTSRDSIMSKVLDAKDLNAYVKMGEASVKFTDEYGIAAISVKQIAARIDITSLTLNIEDADIVTLEHVELINQNTKGCIDGQYNGFVGTSLTKQIENKVFTSGVAQTDICTFYSFANEGGNVTILKLSFKIDGKVVDTIVSVKDKDRKDRVVSAANHQLTITAAIQGENVIPEVTFTVADWNKSQVSVDMEESK